MATSEPELLAEVVRSVYLASATGVVAVERRNVSERLFFRRGELLLDPQHPRAGRLELVRGGATGQPAGAETRPFLLELARDLGRFRYVRATFDPEGGLPTGLKGPLPTYFFALEMAVQGSNDHDLLDRLGGAAARYGRQVASPAAGQPLDLDMSRLLARLERPQSVTQLLRNADGGRLEILRALAKLRAVGLVSLIATAAEPGERVPAKILERFRQRIASDLDGEPLALAVAEHRQELANLLSRLDQLDHYQLLGVDRKATTEQVYSAYRELARRVHPSHAGRLGLGGKEEAIGVLFERATEAYLVLSDPERRSSYHVVANLQSEVEVDAAQREKEKRALAQQHYRRAMAALGHMDFSLAVDLLKEATRLDRQPQYLMRLGQAQSENPHWHRHAVDSYRQAVELAPRDAAIRLGYGELFAKLGRTDEAKQQYRTALEITPGYVPAVKALEKLNNAQLERAASKLGDGLRQFLGERPPKT